MPIHNHAATNADESISGRAHRMRWTRAEKAINALFWFDRRGDQGHCELAYLRDVVRAKRTIRQHDASLAQREGRSAN